MLGDVRHGEGFMKRVAIVAALLLVWPAAAQAGVSGPMKIQVFTRPADSACVSVKGTNSTAHQTGITWDGTQLLVSCWGDKYVDEVAPGDGTTATWLGRLEVDGLPGPGIGAIAWDSTDGVLWACAIDPGTKPQLSAQIGTVAFDPITGAGTWQLAGTAPHGCVNNVAWADGELWADGAYKRSNGTSRFIDTGPAAAPLALAPLPDGSIFTGSGNVSGMIPGSDGAPLWEADNTGTNKSIWRAGVKIEAGSLRFEQLACDEALGRVYVKWFNQNRFGTIDPDPTVGREGC
jgi:hypothetical protein